jgi:hypothetical protein
MEFTFNNAEELRAAFEAGKIEHPRFVSIRNYENKQGEIANYLINLGVSYEHLLQEDLIVLSFLSPQDFDFPANVEPHSSDAYDELIKSLEKNVSNDKSEHTKMSQVQSDTYSKLVPNVKYHNETGQIYIVGLLVKKTIIRPGNYKQVNSRPKTIAKNIMRKTLKSTKYRQFILSNINTMRINGKELILEQAS